MDKKSTELLETRCWGLFYITVSGVGETELDTIGQPLWEIAIMAYNRLAENPISSEKSDFPFSVTEFNPIGRKIMLEGKLVLC